MLTQSLAVINTALSALSRLTGGSYSYIPQTPPQSPWATVLPVGWDPFDTPTDAEVSIEITLLGDLLRTVSEVPTLAFFDLVEQVVEALRPLTVGTSDGFRIRLGEVRDFRVVEVGEQSRWAATVDLSVVVAWQTSSQ